MNPLNKNLRPLPRTWDESQRNATYATAIQTFKSDTRLALNFLTEALQGAFIVGVTGGAIFSATYFLLGRI
jgi:hypothetical protein